MKRFHFSVLCLVAALATFSSCSKDDDSSNLPQKNMYSGMNATDISFNGTVLAGKSANFVPEDGKATITYYSKFEWSQLSDALKDAPAIDSQGVLPGSPKLNISTPIKADGSSYTFSGKGETDFVTYSYSGSVSIEKLTTSFTDVLLKDQRFAGIAGSPMAAPTDPLSDQQPFHIVWQTAVPIQIPGLEYGIQDLLRVLVNVPFISVYNNTATMSLSQVVANGLRSIALDKEGTMPVTYLQTANGASVFTLAPKCMIQYVPLSEASVKLYPNPTDLLSLILLNSGKHDPNIPDNPFGAPSRANKPLTELLEDLVIYLAPMLSNGVPAACVRDNETLAIYLPSQVTLELLKQHLIPIMANPATRGIVQDLVESNEKLEPYSLAIMALYDALPQILEQTTKLELGLNFNLIK